MRGREVAVIVRVKLLSDLRKYLRGRPEPIVAVLAPGAVVADLVRELGIDPGDEMIVGVNGQLASPESQLSDGDEVMLMTPMSGG